MTHDKTIAIIQARMSSRRLPGKMMLDLAGKPVIHRVMERVKLAKTVDEVWLATTTEEYDDVLVEEAKKNNIAVYRGSTEDVLDRFYQIIKVENPGIVVRVTADNPLTSPELIDLAVEELRKGKHDYVRMENLPYGSGAEVLPRETLIIAYEEATEEYDREHVTPFIKADPDRFDIEAMEPDEELQRPDIRVTLDTLDDYLFLYKVFHEFIGSNTEISLREAIAYIDDM